MFHTDTVTWLYTLGCLTQDKCRPYALALMCVPGTLLLSSCQEFFDHSISVWGCKKWRKGYRQFNTFQMSTLLSTFNFQLTIYQSAKRGLRDTCAMSLHSLYHRNEQTSQLFSNIDMIRNDITERFRLTDTTPSFREWLGILNLREFFCLLDNLRKIPDNLHVYSGWPRKHLCPGNHLVVLKKCMYKNKKERKKENKEVPWVMFLLGGYVSV